MYLLEGGTEVWIDFAIVRIEFMGKIVGGAVLFGDVKADPLLGVASLESLGIDINPLSQQLKKLPAVRLKSL